MKHTYSMKKGFPLRPFPATWNKEGGTLFS